MLRFPWSEWKPLTDIAEAIPREMSWRDEGMPTEDELYQKALALVACRLGSIRLCNIFSAGAR